MRAHQNAVLWLLALEGVDMGVPYALRGVAYALWSSSTSVDTPELEVVRVSGGTAATCCLPDTPVGWTSSGGGWSELDG